MIETRFKHTEVGLIPEDWEIITVGQLCSSFRLGGNYPNSNVSNAYPLIKMGNIQRGFISLNKLMYITSGLASDKDRLHEGMVLLNTRNTPDLVGKVAIWRSELPTAYYNSNILHLQQKDFVNPYYLNLAFNTPLAVERMKTIAMGTTSVAAIYTRHLVNFLLPIPKKSEQNKIAKAFEDIDSLISNLEELIEKKRNIKQGVMQELLSGKRRLKGYEKDWGWQKVFDLTGKISRGQTLKADDFKHGEIPVIAGGRQYAGYHNIANHLERTITISGSGASAGFVLLHNQPIFATDCSVISKSVKFDLNFLYYCLRFHQDDLFKLQTGGAQPHVYPRDIQALDIFIPSDKNEQIAIANVLTDMEDEIQILEERLKKYQALKQGMMQQLLTGKIRLI